MLFLCIFLTYFISALTHYDSLRLLSTMLLFKDPVMNSMNAPFNFHSNDRYSQAGQVEGSFSFLEMLFFHF